MTPSARLAHLRSLLVRPRVRRVGAIVLVAIVVIEGLLALGVPYAVERWVPARASQALGRTVTLERARFNPLTLALTLDGLRIAEPDGSDFASVRHAVVNASSASLWHRAPVFDAIEIDGVRVKLVRTAPQRFNVSDIVERLAQRPTDPHAPPARFSAANLRLRNGRVEVDDRPSGTTHVVDAIDVSVPFVSNFDAALDVEVEPAVSMTLDGSRIEARAESTPFQATRATHMRVKIDALDVTRFSELIPVPLGFKIASARLSSDVTLDFAEDNATRTPRLRVSGPLRIDALDLRHHDGRALVAAQAVAATLDDVQPFNRRAWLASLTVEAPRIAITRQPDGHLDVVQALAGATKASPDHATRTHPTPPRAAQPSSPDAASEATPEAAAEPLDWRVTIGEVRDGTLTFADRSLAHRFDAVLAPIHAVIGSIGSHVDAPGRSEVTVSLKGSSQTKAGEDATLRWRGVLDLAHAKAEGTLDAQRVPIARAQPYLDRSLALVLRDGSLDLDTPLALRWGGPEVDLALDGGRLALDHLAITRADRAPLVVATRLSADGLRVRLHDRHVELRSLTSNGLDVTVTRDAQGLDVLRLVKPADATSGLRRIDATASTTTPPAWAVQVDTLDLQRNAIHWRDTTNSHPAAIAITPIDGRLEHLSTQGAAPASVRLRIGVAGDDAGARVGGGTVAVDGTIVPATLQTRLTVDVSALPLRLAQPYLDDRLQIALAAGTLAMKGALSLDRAPAGLRIGWRGSAGASAMRIVEPAREADLLTCGALTVDAIDLSLAPSAPSDADHVAVGRIALKDFFARPEISPQGRLNLLELVRPTPVAGNAAVAAPASRDAPASSPRLRIDIGRIDVAQGRINFTDNFVKPNYRVNVTDLAGGVSALSSRASAPADVTLQGRVDGDAPIDIAGKLDPLGPRVFADIHASAKGIDLPTFSPYSGKYAGYAIEKGKLSLDVRYHLDHGKLDASNRVFLDQLTFGERVDSPNATKLPVQLAVALLKNRRGEIDINLPISGSIDDPQFSVFGILVKVIANLILKAATSPFALLGSLFEQGADLSTAEFVPGTAMLTADSQQRLDTLVKALDDRPALKLEITGRVDPAREHDDVQRARIERLIRRAKLKRLRQNDGDADAARIEITPAERPALLEQVYGETTLPNKPRNVIGLAKSIPPQEMEQRLIEGLPIGPDDYRQLAIRRAQTVRDRIVQGGKIADERVFMLAPRVGTAAADEGREKPACEANCVAFSLR